MALILSITAVLVALVAVTAGATGLLYLAFWLTAALPGVLLGRAIFGRHPAAWITGALAGYAITCLSIWAVIALGRASAVGFTVAWLVSATAMVAVSRRLQRPLIVLRTWTREDSMALAAVLVLVAVLMGPAFRNLGAQDAEGRRYYRAYFTADFVWHMALTAELARFQMPPRNPYVADRHLNYYWTYFLVPAAVTGSTPVVETQTALKVNAIATAVLLLASIYLFAWSSGARGTAVAIAIVLTVLAASAEGAWEIWDLYSRGRSLDALRYMNVDAVTAWRFNGLRIDGIHRTMYYTPQHGLSCALGLAGLVIAMVSGARASLGGTAAAGMFLGLSTTMNPFLGAAFSLMYGLSILVDGVITRSLLTSLARHSAAAVPPVLAVGWSTLNSMAEGAGDALRIGWLEYARNAPLATLLLSLGPVLVPALVGFVPDRRLPGQPARTAAIGLAVGLFLLYFVVLTDKSWVGFRAGQILLVVITVPLARLFDRLFDVRENPPDPFLGGGRRAVAVGIIVAMLLVGLPTTAADAYNASDISNLRMGPGFPWTVVVTPAAREAADWIKHATPSDAVVQMEPVRRGRTQWSLIPSFAERRMGAGLPISLLPRPEYQERSARAQRIFRAATAAEARELAAGLGASYLWVDAGDRAAYPDGVNHIEDAPEYFAPVFRNAEVAVFAVAR